MPISNNVNSIIVLLENTSKCNSKIGKEIQGENYGTGLFLLENCGKIVWIRIVAKNPWKTSNQTMPIACFSQPNKNRQGYSWNTLKMFRSVSLTLTLFAWKQWLCLLFYSSLSSRPGRVFDWFSIDCWGTQNQERETTSKAIFRLSNFPQCENSCESPCHLKTSQIILCLSERNSSRTHHYISKWASDERSSCFKK